MNKNQTNRKEMQDAVLAFMDDHSEKWTPISKVVEFKTELATVNQEIDSSIELQEEAQVFIGRNKANLKRTISQKADILNDSLEALALVSGNQELANKMNASFSALYKKRNIDFTVSIKKVIDEAETHKEVLVNEYGVTEEQITDLKADLDAFLTLNGQPRAYRIASIQATKSLEELFTQANDILENKLDKVMKIFQRRDSNFYNGYLAARVVVNN